MRVEDLVFLHGLDCVCSATIELHAEFFEDAIVVLQHFVVRAGGAYVELLQTIEWTPHPESTREILKGGVLEAAVFVDADALVHAPKSGALGLSDLSPSMVVFSFHPQDLGIWHRLLGAEGLEIFLCDGLKALKTWNAAAREQAEEHKGWPLPRHAVLSQTHTTSLPKVDPDHLFGKINALYVVPITQKQALRFAKFGSLAS